MCGLKWDLGWNFFDRSRAEWDVAGAEVLPVEQEMEMGKN